MNQQRFEDVVGDRIGLIESGLEAKGLEYGRGDRLSNFKTAADLAKTTPEMALRGMMAKHVVSIWDMIDDIEQGLIKMDAQAFKQYATEKIGDNIAYLILLEALIDERIHDKALAEVNQQLLENSKVRKSHHRK